MERSRAESRVRAAARGDQAAQAELWREHRRWVAAVLLAYRPTEVELDDLLQEVAAVFLERLGELRDPTRFRPWLRAIALHTVLRAGRRSGVRRRVIPLEDREPTTPDPAVARDEHEAHTHESSRVLTRLHELPADYREPLLLRSVHGLSQKAIAATLDLSVATVETRLARARRMLRAALAHETPPARRAELTP